MNDLLFGLGNDERVVKAAADAAVDDFLKSGKLPPDGKVSLHKAIRVAVKPGSSRSWRGSGFTAAIRHEKNGEVLATRFDKEGLCLLGSGA